MTERTKIAKEHVAEQKQKQYVENLPNLNIFNMILFALNLNFRIYLAVDEFYNWRFHEEIDLVEVFYNWVRFLVLFLQ
jgi:hypothetical protein